MIFRLPPPAVVVMFCVCLAAAAMTHAGEITGKGFPLRQAPSGEYTYSGQAAAPRAQSYSPNASQIATSPAGAIESAPSSDTPFVSTQAFGAQPISFPDNPRRAQNGAERREYSMPSIWPALLAVLAVCGGFCFLLYLAKKYLPGHRQLFSHPAMEVLGRTHLDQKRYVSLLRVGKRIVVVGVSPDEMRPLSEITDEAEITAIMEVARPKTESGLSIFQKLFKRTVLDVEAAENKAMAKVQAEQLDEQMHSLRRRVREIGRTDSPSSQGKNSVDRIG